MKLKTEINKPEKEAEGKKETAQKKPEMKVSAEDQIFGIDAWKFKAGLPLAVLALVVVVSVSMVIKPKFGQIKKYNTDRQSLETKIADIQQKRAYIQSADENDIRTKHEILMMALPEEKNLHYLLNVVTSQVADYGFAVDSFDISPGEMKSDDGEETKGDISQVSFTVSFIGPKDRYVELINGLENSLPILSLSQLESKSLVDNNVQIDVRLTSNFAASQPVTDIEKLTYKDLVMTENEVALLDKITSFKKIEGLSLYSGGLSSSKQYQQYEIKNPFKAIED